MRKYRRHAIVVILIAAGLLTPSPDAMSQLLLALPIVVLYEVSIVIAARIHKRKEAAHRAFMSDTP
jgi:sec-independent protein translocase protein TatC